MRERMREIEEREIARGVGLGDGEDETYDAYSVIEKIKEISSSAAFFACEGRKGQGELRIHLFLNPQIIFQKEDTKLPRLLNLHFIIHLVLACCLLD